jgi:sugar O-acyltransferase (sialic acid O-acetyltransferase NeuD family)
MTVGHKPIAIAVLGTGGNAMEIVDTIRAINEASSDGPRYRCLGYLDDDRSRWGHTCNGLPVLGPISSAPGFAAQFVNAIGAPGNYGLRPVIVARTTLPAERFETLVHPTAAVSPTARLGRGVVLFPHVTIGSNAVIGDHVLVLPSSVVSHDSAIGAHTCIAAGACISARVEVGDSCYLGTRCCVIGSARIGGGALVGMGAVVLDDVEDGAVVVGNPARVLRQARVRISA